MQLHIHYLSLLMLKFFADVDHIHQGLGVKKNTRESKDFRYQKSLKGELGVKKTCTCTHIQDFHVFQVSILGNAGTCFITVMNWYCPYYMHVVILDCLKAN